MTERTVTVRLRVQADTSGADQLKNKLDDVGGKANRTGGRVGRLTNKLNSMNTAALAVGGAFAGMKLGQMVVNLNRLGIRATRAEEVFTALSGGAEMAQINLDLLRTATSNVVDDLTLMESTNRFLQMGLADSGEEAAELASVAVSLGVSMGREAGPAMEEFALLLANQSIPRLDTFGISAGRVRTRINELRKEFPGMTRETAFLQATMEQANLSLERLGPAANVAVTGTSLVGTGFKNMTQDVAQFTARGIEAGAQLLFIGGYLGGEFLDRLDVVGTKIEQTFGGLFGLFGGEGVTLTPEQLAIMQTAFGSGDLGFQASVQQALAIIQEEERLREERREAEADFRTAEREGSFEIIESEKERNRLAEERRQAEQMFFANERRFAADLQAQAEGIVATLQEASDLSLQGALGQTGGGRLGELGDLVSEGRSEEFQRQLDLLSGRETVASLAIKEQLAPAIDALSDEDAIAAISTLNDTLTLLNANNLDPDAVVSQFGILSLAGLQAQQFSVSSQAGLGLPSGTAFGFGGGEDLGDPAEIFERIDLATDGIADNAAVTADSFTAWREGLEGIEGPTSAIEQAIAAAATDSERMQAAFDAIPSEKTVTVKIVAETSGDTAALGMVSGGARTFNVQDTGGDVPGQDRSNVGQAF